MFKAFSEQTKVRCQKRKRVTFSHESEYGTYCKEELRLDVFVEIVKSSDVRGSVAHDELSLTSTERVNDLIGSRFARNVTLDLNDARNGCHLLKVHSYDLNVTFAVKYDLGQ